MATELETCLNCEHPLEDHYQFCPECGQEARASAGSLKDFFRNFLSDYFTFDSKFMRSFAPLLVKPGFLTNEFFAGRRVRYIPPLRLYIFVSIVFFLVLSVLGNNDTTTTESAFWDAFFGSYLPKVFFVLLPLFALILHLLYLRRPPTYIHHFVFALHYHANLFLLTLAYLLISEIFASFDQIIVNQILSSAFALWFLGYLFIAIKQVYHQSFGRTFLKWLLLLIVYGGVLFVVVSASLLVLTSQSV